MPIAAASSCLRVDWLRWIGWWISKGKSDLHSDQTGFLNCCRITVKTDSRCRSPDGTLEEFKALRDGVPAPVQGELFKLMTSDPDASIQRMVEIAADKGMTVTADELGGFLRQMDEDDEFDDFELDAVALVAIAGGTTRNGRMF